MNAQTQIRWPVFRALFTGLLSASVCVGVWILVGEGSPAAPAACGAIALAATTWAAASSGTRGIFVLLVCLVSTVVVASIVASAWWVMMGVPFFFMGILFFTIRRWMESEGYV